jgi:hypothetical protein
MLAFLCGAMEYASDGGAGWRERMRVWIQENLNHRVYDPVIEAQRLFSAEEWKGLAEWKTSDLMRYRRALCIAINHDLDMMLRQADYVICLWDDAAARGGGTQAELTTAYRKGIRVYMGTELPLSDISGWILACTDRIFTRFDELKAFLAATYGKDARQQALWK